MRTKKVSNRTFYSMIAVIVLLVVICAGTTLALFTDRLFSSNEENKYTFGKIDIAWNGEEPQYAAKRTIGIDSTEHLMPGDEITIEAEIANKEEAAFVRKIVEITFECGGEICGKAEHAHDAECEGEGVCTLEHTHGLDCYVSAAERTALIESFTEADTVHNWTVIEGDVANVTVEDGEDLDAAKLAEAKKGVKFQFVEIVALDSPGNELNEQTSTSGYDDMPLVTNADVAVLIPITLSNAWVDLQVSASLEVEAVQQANMIAIDKKGKTSVAGEEYEHQDIAAVVYSTNGKTIRTEEEFQAMVAATVAGEDITAEEIEEFADDNGLTVYYSIYNAQRVPTDVTIGDLNHDIQPVQP